MVPKGLKRRKRVFRRYEINRIVKRHECMKVKAEALVQKIIEQGRRNKYDPQLDTATSQ